MEFFKFISTDAFILAPCLYVIGEIIKKTELIDKKNIPLILLPLAIGGAVGLLGFSVQNVLQGVLCCGGAVFCHEVAKIIKEGDGK